MASFDKWNDRSVIPPPVCTCPYPVGEIDSGDLRSALRKLQHAQSVLGDAVQWNSEKFVLSRLVFKLNNPLSMKKWHKGLKKVERCMNRYKDMELLKHLSNCADSWASGAQAKASATFYLPSRQMVEFLLVKLMGAAQLMRQIASYCVDVYLYVTQQLSLGHFVHTMLVVAALVSRVWVMSRSLALHMCQWYDCLRSLHSRLKGSEVNWLPRNGAILPEKLELWLEETGQVEHADITLPSHGMSTSASQVDNIFKSLQFGDRDPYDDDNVASNPRVPSNTSLALADDNDIGQPIVQESSMSAISSEVIKPKKKCKRKQRQLQESLQQSVGTEQSPERKLSGQNRFTESNTSVKQKGKKIKRRHETAAANEPPAKRTCSLNGKSDKEKQDSKPAIRSKSAFPEPKKKLNSDRLSKLNKLSRKKTKTHTQSNEILSLMHSDNTEKLTEIASYKQKTLIAGKKELHNETVTCPKLNPELMIDKKKKQKKRKKQEKQNKQISRNLVPVTRKKQKNKPKRNQKKKNRGKKEKQK